jgi:hypothetical protein
LLEQQLAQEEQPEAVEKMNQQIRELEVERVEACRVAVEPKLNMLTGRLRVPGSTENAAWRNPSSVASTCRCVLW